MTLAALTSIDPATGKAFLGAVNASLNALSAVLLVTAFVMIKQRKWRAHATFMIAAVCTSALFLTFYLSSYYLFGEKTAGLARNNWLFWLYLIVLVPHVLLAVGMLPLIGMALPAGLPAQVPPAHALEHPRLLDLALRFGHGRGRLLHALPPAALRGIS